MNTKLKVIIRRMTFLMPHQEVLPDLKELATEIYPLGADPDAIDRNSPEYLMGAYEALATLADMLAEKGPDNI